VPSPFAEPATLWPHDETAHQCPAAFGAAPHCGTMMLCRPRRLCRLVARVVTTPLLATALALFLHQYPVTPLSATASSWSIKGRIRVAPPSLPTHFQPTRPPSQTWLTHPLGSTRARFCSLLSLRPPFRGKISRACRALGKHCMLSGLIHLPKFIKNLTLTVFVSFIIYRVQFIFMYALFV